MNRLLTLIAAVGVVGATVAPPAVTQAAAPLGAYTERWCAAGAPTPCVESSSVNGTPMAPGTGDYRIITSGWYAENGGGASWMVTSSTGDPDLGSAAAAKMFTIRLNYGTRDVRSVWGRGWSGSTSQTSTDAAGNTIVTITARPVLRTQYCQTSTCPTVSPKDSVSLEFESTGGGKEYDGSGFWTNTDMIDWLPIAGGSATYPSLSVGLYNGAHFLSDGTTVFTGNVRMRLAYPLLRAEFGITDPETLAASGLSATISGGTTGTVTVYPDPAGGAFFVESHGATFTKRTLKVVRGLVVPTRPLKVRGTRTSKTTGRLTFTASKARGSRITGYQARCFVSRTQSFTRSGHGTKLRLKGLKPGTSYDCRVRATSKAGPGRWSRLVIL